MLYLWRQLVKIARKHFDEVLSDPEAAKHPEKLSQLLHLVRSLQNIELIDMDFSKLLGHRQSSNQLARSMVAEVSVENFES